MPERERDVLGGIVLFLIAIPALPVALLYAALSLSLKWAWRLGRRLVPGSQSGRHPATATAVTCLSKPDRANAAVLRTHEMSAASITRDRATGAITKAEEAYLIAYEALRASYDSYIDSLRPGTDEYRQCCQSLQALLEPTGPPLDTSYLNVRLTADQARSMGRVKEKLAALKSPTNDPVDEAIRLWAYTSRMALEQKAMVDPRDDVLFLEWMQRYVGFWSDGNAEYGIRRREDGWLQGYRITPPGGFVPAVWLVKHAHKTGGPPGPLGMRPIIVTPALAKYWLTPAADGSYPGSIHVSQGRRLIVEAVENRMREADAASIQGFWRAQWAAWPREPLTDDDIALGALLRAQYDMAS